MQNKYPDLYSLLESDGEARQYFDAPPITCRNAFEIVPVVSIHLKVFVMQRTSIPAAMIKFSKAVSHETVFCNI